MATNLGAAGPHLPPPSLPPSSCLQKIHSVKYWQSAAVGLTAAPTVRFRSWGAPHAHALQHAILWRLSCHCETPTLGCLCQQWPCALSLSVLFMGTREVARRVAGSGRAFLQHCSLYPALKWQDAAANSSGCWADSVCINHLKGVVYLAKLLKHKVWVPNI